MSRAEPDTCVSAKCPGGAGTARPSGDCTPQTPSPEHCEGRPLTSPPLLDCKLLLWLLGLELSARRWGDSDIDFLSTYHFTNNALRRFLTLAHFIFIMTMLSNIVMPVFVQETGAQFGWELKILPLSRGRPGL